jgi:hypothetical protein
MAKQQCDFAVESAIAHRAAATFDCALHAVFDGVGVEMEFLGGRLEA